MASVLLRIKIDVALHEHTQLPFQPPHIDDAIISRHEAFCFSLDTEHGIGETLYQSMRDSYTSNLFMLPSTKFILSGFSESTTSYNDDSMSVTYEIGFGTSDVESLSFSTDRNMAIPKDYWFGRKYFECVMAQNLLHHTRLYESAASIDSKLEENIRSFPYLRSLERLESSGLSEFISPRNETNIDPYHDMLASIGAVLRNGRREDRAELLVLLREQAEESVPSTFRASDESSSPPRREHQRNPRLQTLPNGAGSSPTLLGQYSSALQEYGAQHDFAPTYDVRALSTIPPRFIATVSFGEFSFEGMARSKKQAKHQAAREACSSLGIQI